MQDTAAVIFCPKRLILSGLVMMDDSICRLQNFLRGTVILLQLNYGCIGKILFKIQNIADICPTPAIDALVIIPDHAEIFIFCRKHCHQLILACICILIFIHHNIAESFLIFFQNNGKLTEQQNGFINQIVKIQRVVFLKHFLIGLIYLCDTHCLQVIFIHMLRVVLPACHFLLQMADDAHCPLNGKGLIRCAHIQPLEGFAHDFFLIVTVIDRKLIFIIQMLNFSAQNPHTGGMEGADPHISCCIPHKLFHTLAHFLRRLIRKGNRKNIPRLYTRFQQMCNPHRQGTGLAAACPRQNQHRPFCLQNCFFLHIVQFIKSNHVILSHFFSVSAFFAGCQHKKG